MKRIAIFGCAGYLGRQMVCFFSQRNVIVDGFDIPKCDITDASFWDDFNAAIYDAILFFSGLTGTEDGFHNADKFTSVNEIGLLLLLMRLSSLGRNSPRVIFPSTRLVYKGGDLPLREDAPKDPKTIYAVNKLACEEYLAVYSNRFGIPYDVIRICVPYGNIVSAEYSYGTIGFFMSQLAKENTISLFGSGEVRRTFTHVLDICRAVECLCFGETNGIYNVGGSDLSLKEAAEIVAERKGGGVTFAPWPETARLIESGSTVFDASALSTDFGYSSEISFADNIKGLEIW